MSLGQSPYNPNALGVGTVTIRSEVSGEGVSQPRNIPTLCPSMPGCEGIRIDDTFLGLTPLNKVSGSAKAYLVAVTGLAGRAFESWQSDGGVMWLRDLLPFDHPYIQVLIYGYPSKVRQSLSRASIQDFADNFLLEMARVLGDSIDAQTPLILVGHSLGCIIIKQAIVDSVSALASSSKLHRHVCGIVFFGAPHRGLNNPELELAVEGTAPDELVRDLRPNSSLLVSLNQTFPNACKDIKIISCYETHWTLTYELAVPDDPSSGWNKTGPPRFMVPESSACLDWPISRETRIPIHADHSNIAKQDDSAGSAYHHLKEEIGHLAESAGELMKRREGTNLVTQNIPYLFFVFQYEYWWLMAWNSHLSGYLPSHTTFLEALEDPESILRFSHIPYGHTAYPIINELSLLLKELQNLVRNYRKSQSKPTFVGSGKRDHEKIPNIERDYDVYDLQSWSDADRIRLGSIITQFRVSNQQLSKLGLHGASVDIITSSKVLKQLENSPSALQQIERASRAANPYKAFLQRVLFRKQNEEQYSSEALPNKYPIAWIEMRKGTGSSNYRVLTTFKEKTSSSSAVQRPPRWIMVEWRSYEMIRDLKLMRQSEKQAQKLAYTLSSSNKPPLLRTLTCAGLVQDVDKRQFGFLFELPDFVDVTKEPLTLYSLLAHDFMRKKPDLLPTLSVRFRLAKDLAYSVAELHAAVTLHKNLHSGNVFFFPERFTDSITFERPFLGGFEVSRPDSHGQLSMDVEGGIYDVYRHPDFQDSSNELQGRPNSQRKHDVYSLGLILLEIGLWKRLDSLRGKHSTPTENANNFLKLAKRFLPHLMGNSYGDAVLECLDINRQGLSKRQEIVESPEDTSLQDERGGISLELFVEKVIRRLEEHCHNF